MRPLFLFTFLISNFWGAAQDSTIYSVSFKLENLLTSEKIHTIDSLNILYNGNLEIRKNVAVNDGILTIKNLRAGEYTFSFKSETFTMQDYPIVICQKCERTFSAIIIPKSINTNPWLITSMKIGPHYKNGYKKLNSDFLSKLTDIDKDSLHNSSNFVSVKFIVTKKGELCDPLIEDANKISKEIKAIIFKGLSGLTNWKHGIVNGIPADGVYTLKIESLFED